MKLIPGWNFHPGAGNELKSSRGEISSRLVHVNTQKSLTMDELKFHPGMSPSQDENSHVKAPLEEKRT